MKILPSILNITLLISLATFPEKGITQNILHLESDHNAEYPLLITSNNGIVRTNNWGHIQLQNDAGSTSDFWHLGHRNDNSFDIAYGPEMNFIIPKSNSKLCILPNGNIGIGIGNPMGKLHVGGNAIVEGNLEINGTLSGVDVDVSQITGLLGQGYSAVFPVVLDNTVDLEVVGVGSITPVLIYSSIGFESERISIPFLGGFTEEIGFTMEFPLEFETDDPTFIAQLQAWFDDASPITRDAQLIIRQLNGTETARWSFLAYLPDGYQPGNDGRTRFRMIHSEAPDSDLKATYDADFGNSLSFNPATDKRVEISGSGIDIGDPCTPQVEVDNIERTITLIFDYNEGYQILDWIEETVAGNVATPSAVSVIETTNGTNEISRIDYLECRPIRYEHIYGFGLNTKLQARVVLAYGLMSNPP